MKKAGLLIFAVSILLLLLCSGAKAAAHNQVIVKTLYGNVLSTEYQSKVVLRGTKENNSPYIANIRIDIYDQGGNVTKTIAPDIDSGYGPDIALLNFSLDPKLDQIFFGLNSGGSGGFGYFYVYSLEGGESRTLFDFEQFGRENQYKGKYLDNYLVEITSKDGNEIYLIDLSRRSQSYLDMVWNKEGKLITPREANVSGVNTVFPYYNYLTKNYQLMIMQRVTGLYNADGLGYINTQQSLENNKFTTFFRGLEIFPSNS